MKHKNHEESDLQCNFSHFRNYIRKCYHKLSFVILILRDSDLFGFRHEVMLLLLIRPGQNRSKYKFSLISKAYFSRAIEVILPKTVPGVPKKVHKFEIKNLCSENRSINKVSVIC